MPVFKRPVKGKKMWVIDRWFSPVAREPQRYRRVAQVQTRDAAEAEERRIQDHFATYGNIDALLEPKSRKKVEPTAETKVYTWEDAVEHYKRVELPMRKPSVREGYSAVLAQPILRYWAGRPLVAITRAEMKKWEAWAT